MTEEKQATKIEQVEVTKVVETPKSVEEKKEEKISTEEHIAKAKAKDLSVSTKHCIEICSYLRYKTTAFSKRFLEEVIAIKKPVPFKKFKKNVGHKPGMAAGRFPEKAAKEVLKLIKSVEANAQNKGLNTSSLKIIKMLANKAAVPVTGGRHRTGTKRTHLEIEVKEVKLKDKKQEERSSSAQKKQKFLLEKERKADKKTSEKKDKKEVKQAPILDKKMEEKLEPKNEAPKVEEKKVEVKKPEETLPTQAEVKQEAPKEESIEKIKPEGEQSK